MWDQRSEGGTFDVFTKHLPTFVSSREEKCVAGKENIFFIRTTYLLVRERGKCLFLIETYSREISVGKMSNAAARSGCVAS